MTSPECLSDDDVIQLVEGRLTPDRLASAERHLSSCDECPRLVAEAAREISGSDGARAASPPDEDPAPLARDEQVGRYVILRSVGEGAMGRVYAAHDPELDRTVALKLLHKRVASPDLEARLRREAKSMARLSHPEVITVYDAGRQGDQLFIAMELVDGGTIRQWLAERKRPWREVLAVFLRAGRGLAVAHEAGLVHRDFKPDNVLIGKDGRVRVTDFGLARAVEGVADDDASPSEPSEVEGSTERPLTRTGMLVGTPAYMAPEQLRGVPADARADVYAFCLSLYEALYGERPFASATFAALRSAKRDGRVRPAPQGTAVPKRLRRALLVGLAPRPEDRYASMTGALAALERASRASRSPWIAAGALAVAGVAVGAFAVARTSEGPAVIASSSSASSSASAANAIHCTPSACNASHPGVPHACRPSDGACIPIASEDCTPTFEPGDLLADDTVWIGVMFPLTGPGAETHGKMNADGVEFARRELAEATRALESSTASKHVRRLALVTCDDVANPERAARHLVQDLGVPAIAGFGSGQKLVDLAGPILIPSRVLAIATLSSNPLVTHVPQPDDLPRMIWRTTYSLHDVAAAAARFLHDVLEPRISGGGATRVTMARGDRPAGLWFSEELYRRLVFNGKSTVENGAAYQEVTLPSEAPSPAVLRTLAEKTIATQPTFVVLSGSTDVTTPLIVEIEARWPADRPRPTYVISDNSIQSLASFMGSDIRRRRRIFAITSVSNDMPAARFVIRYNAVHAKPVTTYFNPGAGYDAFYMLAYASFAIDSARFDGPALARNFTRLLPPGRSIEVGPMAVFDAISALERGETIDLRGVSNPLDFDPKTGEGATDFALVCASVDALGRAKGDLESGVYYRTASMKVDGVLRCP